jgi:hypothetical protein
LQLALWGWPCTNVYRIFITDVLHQDYNGMIKHFITALKQLAVLRFGSQAEADRKWAAINHKLASMSALLGARIPTQGFDAPQLNAMERKGMWQFLAVAANGTWPDDMVHFVAEYAKLQHLRDSPVHTASSTLQLRQQTAR